jgi:hypothetical protein
MSKYLNLLRIRNIDDANTKHMRECGSRLLRIEYVWMEPDQSSHSPKSTWPQHSPLHNVLDMHVLERNRRDYRYSTYYQLRPHLAALATLPATANAEFTEGMSFSSDQTAASLRCSSWKL